MSLPLYFAIWLLMFGGLQAGDATKGKVAYQMNCMACHQMDVKVVGPSVVAVAATYPEDKRADFIAWAKEPGKKDPKLLQMPPMAHVPEKTLADIHEYMLQEAVGKTEKKRSQLFPPFKEPRRELPYVVRAFLPKTSPASVAIVLKGNISICWDPEACRFRYAWAGSKTRLRQGHTVVELEEDPFYAEDSHPLQSLLGVSEPEFYGYRILQDGAPEFAYSIGEVEVRERIANGAEPGTFVRSFTLVPAVDELKIPLGETSESQVICDKGALETGLLTVSGDDTQSFTLTISKQ